VVAAYSVTASCARRPRTSPSLLPLECSPESAMLAEAPSSSKHLSAVVNLQSPLSTGPVRRSDAATRLLEAAKLKNGQIKSTGVRSDTISSSDGGATTSDTTIRSHVRNRLIVSVFSRACKVQTMSGRGLEYTLTMYSQSSVQARRITNSNQQHTNQCQTIPENQPNANIQPSLGQRQFVIQRISLRHSNSILVLPSIKFKSKNTSS
jgi:hypothetical protein